MIPSRFVLRGLAALLLVVSYSIGATPWQWRDAQGRMVYSDRPPPADVRAAQIVRSPAAPAAPASDAGADATPPKSTAATPAGTAPSVPTWVERERAFRARQAEREENEAKAREESERAATAQRACDETRRAVRTLESGLRVVSVNARGEAETIDDTERAQRLKTARAELERHCAGR